LVIGKKGARNLRSPKKRDRTVGETEKIAKMETKSAPHREKETGCRKLGKKLKGAGDQGAWLLRTTSRGRENPGGRGFTLRDCWGLGKVVKESKVVEKTAKQKKVLKAGRGTNYNSARN